MPLRPLNPARRPEPQRRSVVHGTALFGAVCGLALAGIVVLPLLRLLLASLGRAHAGDAFASAFAILVHPRTLMAMADTLAMGVATMLLAAAFAVPLAWATARTDMPFRRQLRSAMLATVAMPPLAVGVGWILLVSWGGGSSGLGWLQSRGGIVAILALATQFPIFAATSAALAEISSEMEEAGRHAGADTAALVRYITLPHVAPAILASMISAFLRAIGVFSVPALLAIPADIPVMSTEIWLQFTAHAPLPTLAALAMPVAIVSVLVLRLRRGLRRRYRHSVPRTTGDAPVLVKLGPWRWPVSICVTAIWALTVGLPIAALVGTVLSPPVRADTSSALADLVHAAINTVLYGIAAATVALALAIVIAYGVRRHLVAFGHWLTALCLATLAAPGIVLATAFAAAYAPGASMLDGTVTVVILAFTARLLPPAYRMASAATEGLHVELEEAARMHGATWWTTIRRVVVPELEWPLLGIWVALFITASQELSAAVLLFAPATRTLSFAAFQAAAGGQFWQSASLVCWQLLISMTVVHLATRLLGRDFILRQS